MPRTLCRAPGSWPRGVCAAAQLLSGPVHVHRSRLGAAFRIDRGEQSPLRDDTARVSVPCSARVQHNSAVDDAWRCDAALRADGSNLRDNPYRSGLVHQAKRDVSETEKRAGGVCTSNSASLRESAHPPEGHFGIARVCRTCSMALSRLGDFGSGGTHQAACLTCNKHNAWLAR